MRGKRRGVVLTLVLSVLVLAGCRTDKAILNDYEAHVSSGKYTGSAEEVTAKAEAGGGSEQMWRLLAANAAFLADDRPTAIEQFDRTERVFQRNDAKSVFDQAGEGTLAMMTNDKAFDYDGGGLDRIFTCLYRSIDFMASGRKDEARVELNRASQYQTNWLVDRRRDIEAAERRLASDAAAYEREKGSRSTGRSTSVSSAFADASFGAKIRAQTGFDPATSGDLSTLAEKDYLNAYASHLTGVFRWLAGDPDRNELKEAATFSPGNPTAARDYAERRSGVRPQNQVWIFIEDGLCPAREEWRVDLPLMFIPFAGHYVRYAGMALPYLRYRLDGAHFWQAQAGTNLVPFATLESVDRLAKVEYDVYMRGALAREITRTIVRVGAQVALQVVADNTSDSNTRLALALSQWGVAAWSASSVGADLRCWTSLPKTIYALRVDRPADGRVQLIGDGAVQVVLTVPKGNAIVYVRKCAPAAPCVVKTAVFPPDSL